MRQKAYLIRKGYEFLSAMVDYEMDIEKMEPRMSLYKYDAARIPRRNTAEQIQAILTERYPDQKWPWEVVRFNAFTGEVSSLDGN